MTLTHISSQAWSVCTGHDHQEWKPSYDNWVELESTVEDQEPAWAGTAARRAALENDSLNKESLGASGYWLRLSLKGAIEHNEMTNHQWRFKFNWILGHANLWVWMELVIFVRRDTWKSSKRSNESCQPQYVTALDVTTELRSSILLSHSVNLLSHCFVEPLLCWTTTMLSHSRFAEWIARTIWHTFCAFSWYFQAPVAPK